jgi:hypothetical protein
MNNERKINYDKIYRATLSKCFPYADIQVSDIDSTTKGLSLLYDGCKIFHLAYDSFTNGARVKLTMFKLSNYDTVHINILFDGKLPEIQTFEPDLEFLEALIKNREQNNTHYYRLQ